MSNYPKKLLLDFIKSLGPEDMIKAAQAIEKSELGEMFAGVVLGSRNPKNWGLCARYLLKTILNFRKQRRKISGLHGKSGGCVPKHASSNLSNLCMRRGSVME